MHSRDRFRSVDRSDRSTPGPETRTLFKGPWILLVIDPVLIGNRSFVWGVRLGFRLGCSFGVSFGVFVWGFVFETNEPRGPEPVKTTSKRDVRQTSSAPSTKPCGFFHLLMVSFTLGTTGSFFGAPKKREKLLPPPIPVRPPLAEALLESPEALPAPAPLWISSTGAEADALPRPAQHRRRSWNGRALSLGTSQG